MSSFQQSNDDFFNSPLATPPKPSSRLTQTRAAKPAATTGSTTANNSTTRLAKRTATTARRAPPPPPNKAGASSATASASSSVSKPAAAAAAAAASTKPKAARRRPNRLPAPSPHTLQPSGTTNAAASAPSNSFYSNSAASGSASSSGSNTNTNSNTGMGGTGFYNYTTPTPAPAVTAQPDNEWDSWGAPAPAAANTSQQQQQPQVNQWQATPVSTQPQAANNDWYSGSAAATAAGTGMMDSTTPAAPSFNQWQPQQQQPQASPAMQGSMDNAGLAAQPAPVAAPQASMFQPTAFFNNANAAASDSTAMMNNDEDDFENEAPLLEELGIHFDHILLKSKTVCWPFTRTAALQSNTDMVDAVVQDADLIGPICYCLALGGEMVLTGKLQFGYIYGFGLFGCVAMTLIVNLTAPKDAVSFWVVSSVLGYALIPVNILALVKIVIINLASLQKLGRVLGLITVLWSTTASTRLLEIGCGLREQRYLIAYPIALLYSAFVLITIF